MMSVMSMFKVDDVQINWRQTMEEIEVGGQKSFEIPFVPMKPGTELKLIYDSQIMSHTCFNSDKEQRK